MNTFLILFFIVFALAFLFCPAFSLNKWNEHFCSGTPFNNLIRNSPKCNNTPLSDPNDDFGVNPCYTGDYITNYPFGYPPNDLTKYGAYCPHAHWNTCGCFNQRIWKHF